MSRPVMLTIRGEQRYHGQEPDVIELVTEGVLDSMPDGWRITYAESGLTGMAGTQTTFEMQPGSVVLARTGTVQSRMVFTEGVRHDCLYQLDVGALMVGVCAKKIHWEMTEDGGKLDVLYAVEIEQSLAGTVRYTIGVAPQPA